MAAIGVLIALGIAGAIAYTLLQPRYAFVLVLIFFPLEQICEAYIPLLGRVHWLLNVLVGITAVIAAGLNLLRGQRPFLGLNNGQTWAVGALYALVLLGVPMSPSVEGAMQLAVREGIPYWILLMGVLPLLIGGLDDFRKMLPPYMLVGAVLSLLILINPHSSVQSGRLTVEIVNAAGEVERGNPLAVSELGAMVCVVSALLATRAGAMPLLVLRGACFLAGCAVLLASGSRGQAIAMVLAVVAFIPLAYRIRDPRQFVLMAASGLFVLVLGYVAIKLAVGHETAERWSAKSLSVNAMGRVEYSMGMFEAFLSHPGSWLLGLGTSAFNYYMPQEGGFSYPHNLVTEIVTEHGIVGFSLLCVSLWAVWRGWIGLWRANKADPGLRSAAAILGAMALVNLIQSLKQGSFIGIPTPFYFFLVVNKIATREQAAGERVEREWLADQEYAEGLVYASER